MTEDEPTNEVKASSTGLPWPDPSRPIVNEQPGSPGYLPGELQRDWLSQEPRRRRAMAAILVLIVLAAILVAVWLLWWN